MGYHTQTLKKTNNSRRLKVKTLSFSNISVTLQYSRGASRLCHLCGVACMHLTQRVYRSFPICPESAFARYPNILSYPPQDQLSFLEGSRAYLFFSYRPEMRYWYMDVLNFALTLFSATKSRFEAIKEVFSALSKYSTL